jgi:cell division FtsZ-interacting protein ZapD
MSLSILRDLIADDSYAISFQTLGQYRSALLKELDSQEQDTRTWGSTNPLEKSALDYIVWYEQIRAEIGWNEAQHNVRMTLSLPLLPTPKPGQ